MMLGRGPKGEPAAVEISYRSQPSALDAV